MAVQIRQHNITPRYEDLMIALLHEDIVALTELLVDADQDELNLILFRAIFLCDNSDIIELLLNTGSSINHTDSNGRTPLFMAVKHNRLSCVEILLERHCDVALSRLNSSTVLHLAAKNGNSDIVRLLCDAGHPLDETNWGGNSALLIACRFGFTDVVKVLLHSGASVQVCNKLGHFPIHYAAMSGNQALLELLMSYNAEAAVKTYLGISPIMLACERKHCDVVRLLAPRSDLNYREKLYGGTALHWAVASGCEECVKNLLSHGADFRCLDHSGRTPLVQAVQSRCPNVLEMMLEDYPMTAIDLTPQSPNEGLLHLAAYIGDIECVDILCKYDTTKDLINQSDIFSDTPLDIALRQGHDKDLVVLMIERGANTAKFPIQEIDDDAKINLKGSECNSLADKLIALSRESNKNSVNHKPYKTYSPIKLAMIAMLKSASGQQMVAPVKFDFSSWLDDGPEAFVLKVTSLDVTDVLCDCIRSPWSLQELCRGTIRRALGYRATEKTGLLDIPPPLKSYVGMQELEEITSSDIHIRSSSVYNEIDIE